MRRHNVSVSIGSGRYRVVSEPGSHLEWVTTCVNPQALTNSTIGFRLTCLYMNLGFQQRVQEYHDLDDSFLDSVLFLPSFQLSIKASDFLLIFLESSSFPSVSVSSPPYFFIPSSFKIAECAAKVSWTRNL